MMQNQHLNLLKQYTNGYDIVISNVFRTYLIGFKINKT